MDNAFGSVEVTLKKRHDLIPKVKQCMAHEAKLLERAAALRSRAMGAPGPDEAESERSGIG